MTEGTTYTYWGHKPCGCLIWAAVDCPEMARAIARGKAWCVKRGYPVERIPTEEFRALPARCAEHRETSIAQAVLL